MVNYSKLSRLLHDLIQINLDRKNAYDEALREVQDTDHNLRGIFSHLSDQCKNYVQQLDKELSKIGVMPDREHSGFGQLYESWKDLVSSFLSSRPKSLVDVFNQSEAATREIYEDSLLSHHTWNTQVRDIISNQHNEIKTSHEQIKKYCEAYRK